MTIAIIIIGIIIIFFAMSSKSATQKTADFETDLGKKNEQFYLSIIAKETNPIAREILKKIKNIFDQGTSFEGKTLFVELGIPNNVIESDESGAFDKYVKFNNSVAKDLFNTYFNQVCSREINEKRDIFRIDNAFEKYKIILKQNEELYFSDFGNTYMLQEKTIRRNINYTGLRVTSGPLRMGNVSYSTNDIKSMVLQDIGNVFLTNKRIIFKGKQNQKNLEVQINSILDYYIYKDAVLLITNNKKVMFKTAQFASYQQPIDDPVILIYDFPIKFVNMLKRIVEKSL